MQRCGCCADPPIEQATIHQDTERMAARDSPDRGHTGLNATNFLTAISVSASVLAFCCCAWSIGGDRAMGGGCSKRRCCASVVRTFVSFLGACSNRGAWPGTASCSGDAGFQNAQLPGHRAHPQQGPGQRLRLGLTVTYALLRSRNAMVVLCAGFQSGCWHQTCHQQPFLATNPQAAQVNQPAAAWCVLTCILRSGGIESASFSFQPMVSLSLRRYHLTMQCAAESSFEFDHDNILVGAAHSARMLRRVTRGAVPRR